MNISTFITKINNSFKIGKKKNQPTLEEFINRGFAPKDDKIDILFINPFLTVCCFCLSETFNIITTKRNKTATAPT